MKEYVLPRIIYESRQPTRFHDKNSGYVKGQIWIDDYNNAYMCIDNTNENAIWRQFINNDKINYISENYTFTKPEHIFIRQFTDILNITLPINPTIGQVCAITDLSTNAYQNRYRVISPDNIINGQIDYIQMVNDYIETQFIFIGGKIGWKFTLTNPEDIYNSTFGPILNANLNLLQNDSEKRYLIDSNNDITITLPENPEIDTEFSFLDISGNLNIKPLNFNLNGQLFEGQDTHSIKYIENYGYLVVKYISNEIGWMFIRIDDYRIRKIKEPTFIYTKSGIQITTSGLESLTCNNTLSHYTFESRYLKVNYIRGGTF